MQHARCDQHTYNHTRTAHTHGDNTNLIATDTGRPMRDLNMSVLTADIGPMIRHVMDTLEVKEIDYHGAEAGQLTTT